VHPPDVFAKKDILDLAFRLLVQDDAIAVEHANIGGAAVQG